MFSLQGWAWECLWCMLLAGTERSTSKTLLLPWVEKIKQTFPLLHTLKWNGSISLGFITSTSFTNILQIISCCLCIGRETNQFPSIASSVHCWSSFHTSTYHSPHLWWVFSHSYLCYIFPFLFRIKWAEVNPLMKVKRYNRQHYLLPNKVQHFCYPLIIFLCHTDTLAIPILPAAWLCRVNCIHYIFCLGWEKAAAWMCELR